MYISNFTTNMQAMLTDHFSITAAIRIELKSLFLIILYTVPIDGSTFVLTYHAYTSLVIMFSIFLII